MNQYAINHLTVRALMAVRRVSIDTAANLANVKGNSLVAWLNGADDGQALPFDKQIELLSLLGVRGDHPRSDVVHHWHVHQPLFSGAKRDFWAVQALIKAFGPAQATVISRAQDPAWTLQASARFGLRFEKFLAVLEVSAHPLRNISFGPDVLTGLSWASDTFGVLLPPTEYDQMEPGAVEVRSLQRQLTYSEEMGRWDSLRTQALEQGIRAEQLADILRGGASLPALPGEPAVVAQPPVPAPEVVLVPTVDLAPVDEFQELISAPVTR